MEYLLALILAIMAWFAYYDAHPWFATGFFLLAVVFIAIGRLMSKD